MIPKLSKNQISEMTEIYKMVVDRKTFFNPSPTSKIAYYGPKSRKNYTKIKSKSNVRIERNKENEIC